MWIVIVLRVMRSASVKVAEELQISCRRASETCSTCSSLIEAGAAASATSSLLLTWILWNLLNF